VLSSQLEVQPTITLRQAIKQVSSTVVLYQQEGRKDKSDSGHSNAVAAEPPRYEIQKSANRIQKKSKRYLRKTNDLLAVVSFLVF